MLLPLLACSDLFMCQPFDLLCTLGGTRDALLDLCIHFPGFRIATQGLVDRTDSFLIDILWDSYEIPGILPGDA